MKLCDLPVSVFVQGWLMMLAGIHQKLTDEVLSEAVNQTSSVVCANPQFGLNPAQAAELVGLQLIALAIQETNPDISLFAERCLMILLKETVSDN